MITDTSFACAHCGGIFALATRTPIPLPMGGAVCSHYCERRARVDALSKKGKPDE